MSRLAFPLAGLVLAATLACAQAQTASMTNPDQQFAVKAASGGHAEVELGHLALSRSNRGDVREFAQRMVDDHSKANLNLSELAMRQHMRLPRAAEGEDAAEIKRLAEFEGDSFDRSYIDLMVNDHRHDVADFERQARDGQMASIRSFANATLPMLREHLHMAEQLQKSYGEEKAQAPSSGSSKGPMQ